MTLDSIGKLLAIAQQKETWPIPLDFREIQKNWESLVGEKIARNSRPTGLVNDVLWVSVASSVWSQELSFKRRDIIRRIKERVTELKDIRFSPGNWTRSPLPQTEDFSAHPSFVGKAEVVNSSNKVKATPIESFQAWAERVKARSASLPLCPKCNCPTPTGELERWGNCVVCFSLSRPTWKTPPESTQKIRKVIETPRGK